MFIMMWFKIVAFFVVDIFSLLSVHTVPFNSVEETSHIFKRDIESVVSSSVVKILPPEIKAKYDIVKSLHTYPKAVQSRWSKNDSFMEDLEDMFASIERELDEILNKTKTGGFNLNDEFFSFSFSDSESESASKSEEQTAPPEVVET